MPELETKITDDQWRALALSEIEYGGAEDAAAEVFLSTCMVIRDSKTVDQLRSRWTGIYRWLKKHLSDAAMEALTELAQQQKKVLEG